MVVGSAETTKRTETTQSTKVTEVTEVTGITGVTEVEEVKKTKEPIKEIKEIKEINEINKINRTKEQESLAQNFVRFAVESGVLRLGEFKTKAGRLSPYFFNAGLFDDGAKMGRLAEFYAQALIASGIQFDMVFGPAYKGIPLAATVAVELARRGRNVAFAYNRKEAKDHGEGGTLVGAPLQGRVLIVDDVMSAGTAARESIALIQAAGAIPYAMAIALDRQEKATENGQDVPHSAVQYVRQQLGLHVCTIATLADLLQYLGQGSAPDAAAHRERVMAYRERYGVI